MTPSQWLTAHLEAPAEQVAAVRLLDLLERRDLEAASRVLASGFAMVFPGPSRPSNLTAMAEGAKKRYHRVAKMIEDVESFEREGAAVVYVRGTLYGENLHGVAFEGVRFVDRFEYRAGRFERQDVWNDLAESGVLERRA